MKDIDNIYAEKVLDYWYTIEFLSQDSYPNGYDIINKVKRHKTDCAKGNRKNKSIETFIQLSSEDIDSNLYEIILDEALTCGMKKWGNLTFYIGKIKREKCIERIAEVIPHEYKEERPEKSNDKIAMLSLQLSPDGKYIKNTLSFSTILWALNQLKMCNGELSKELNGEAYTNIVADMEAKYFSAGKTIKPEELENRYNSDNNIQEFSVESVTLRELHNLYLEIENTYIKDNITSSESDTYEEIYGISFQLFEDSITKQQKEDDNYLGLTHDYFSNDIKLILSKVISGELLNDNYMGKDLERYITVLKDLKNENSERIDLVNPEKQGREEFLLELNEILTVENAPLGKWPSRFMPAMMQEIAINMVVNKGEGKLFDKNGKVFSVNGPPGTGKTTLLKEIVVNNIIERAILLSKWDNPDNAFDEHKFIHGEKAENAYSTYTRHWYSLKDDKVNDYGIFVTSCNNAAVENISKELPKSMMKDLKSLDDDSDELCSMLKEVSKLFEPSETGDDETDCQGDVYKDLYFTKYARDLLDDDSAWGLIAAPLGKKSNIRLFYYKVLYPLARDFYKNKNSAKERLEKYIAAKDKFLKQLKVVKEQQKSIGELRVLLLNKKEQEIIAQTVTEQYESKIKKAGAYAELLRSEIADLKQQRTLNDNRLLSINADIKNEKSNKQKAEKELSDYRENIKQNYAKELEIRSSVGFFTKVFKRAKYQAAMNLADQYKNDAKNFEQMVLNTEDTVKQATSRLKELSEENDHVNQENAKTDSIVHSKHRQLNILLEQITEYEKEIQTARERKEEVEKHYEQEAREFLAGNDLNTGVILDENYVENLLSGDNEKSTKAQVDNPWFTQRYNREREKLFYYAMKMNKEFVLSSNACRYNFITLSQYWGVRMGDDNKKIQFHSDDVNAMTGSLYQTLFLLIPVISSTFASVGSLFKDIKEPGIIGTLVVDEAGQAQPQMAAGALYRSRKAIIVGDPRQVEPVVTDDLKLLKKAYQDKELQPYKEKNISAQSFADRLNYFGTYLENGTEYPEWVGCPLLVHRRCLSPMYDISNHLSYNGIMKQQTRPPKKEVSEKFILTRSMWINVAGKEKGNKNHFVDAQGDMVCKLLEYAFQKSQEPDIYIISPFTTVVQGIKNFIKSYCRKNPGSKIDANYMLDYENKKIGTVHTFQGKEANEVIFLLGCDNSDEAKGAIGWVNNNIVNVAATRAKYRFYIIGDSNAWEKSACVSTAKQIMDKCIN